MRVRRLILVTAVCVVAVFVGTVMVASGRAQAGERPVVHTCSALDKQYLDVVSSNMSQLSYWSDSLAHNEADSAEVVKQARSEAEQIDETRPTDPTLEQSRSLLRSMFIDYARAVSARMHRRDAGRPMGAAYQLANNVHDLLAGAQPALAARGCDPASLLQ